uniref:Uncharacterized protein n=1 Tax=Solanum tuberosum TaxID=4113 RepID=M1DF50_SOLTU
MQFPVTKFEDPLLGSSKGRPQMASRTVKPLTGHGSGREKARQVSPSSIRTHFKHSILNYFRSKGAQLIPYDSELQKTLRKMVNAQELEAQKQRLGLEAEAAARGVQQNGGNNQPRVVDENRGMDGLIPPSANQ